MKETAHTHTSRLTFTHKFKCAWIRFGASVYVRCNHCLHSWKTYTRFKFVYECTMGLLAISGSWIVCSHLLCVCFIFIGFAYFQYKNLLCVFKCRHQYTKFDLNGMNIIIIYIKYLSIQLKRWFEQNNFAGPGPKYIRAATHPLRLLEQKRKKLSISHASIEISIN